VKPGRLLLLRHGPTEWSLAGRHTGRTDLPLTDAGKPQVRELAAALTAWQFPLCLSSPLKRAWETALLAGLLPEAEPDLQEWDYGQYEGLTSAAIQAQRRAVGEAPWSLWREGCPGGERPPQVAARVDRVLQRISPRIEAGEPVALVAHGHVLRVLAARWLGQAPEAGAGLMLDAARACVLDQEHGTRALRVWNAGPHALEP